MIGCPLLLCVAVLGAVPAGLLGVRARPWPGAAPGAWVAAFRRARSG